MFEAVKQNKCRRGKFENMWELICLRSMYRRTYKRPSQPAALEGIVVVLGGYDA